MRNPFTLGIVKKKDFCDREKEIDNLLRYAENGQNVVLFSPRRYGKSSLVSQVFELLAGKGLLTIYDLFPISSERDFVTRFSTAIFRSIGKGAYPRTMAAKFKNLFSISSLIAKSFLHHKNYRYYAKISRALPYTLHFLGFQCQIV